MQKLVINTCYGGFGLSNKAKEMYAELSGKKINDWDIPRNDLHLIVVVMQLREKANDEHSDLKIIEIPDGVEWIIEEYDGNEWVAEKHRTWGQSAY
jgi:hypothetical protein